MPIPRTDSARCQRRNRRAAHLRETAIPIRFQPEAPDSMEARLVKSIGTIPEGDAAVRLINQRQGLDGDRALKLDQVLLLYPEVANSNYISDRAMFLHSSTLKNIQRYAVDGFAFMNSHRTGSYSTESELPFGRTYAGRYEVWEGPDGERFGRTLLGAYMLAGQRPNGANGPSTDELYAGINAGTIFDVSVGLREFDLICDVCGEDLNGSDPETGRDLCPHVPGTHVKMTDDEIQAQEARGVPDGVASFSLVDGIPGEFSAVYDGAVPGAGFRKAARLVRAAARGTVRLRAGDLDRLAGLYGPFFSRGTGQRLDRLAGSPVRGVSRFRRLAMPFPFGRGRGRARLVDNQNRPVGQVEFLADDDDDDGYDNPPPSPRRLAAGSNAGSGDPNGGHRAEPPATAPDPAVAELRTELQQLRTMLEQSNQANQQLVQARDQDLRARLRKEAERFARNLLRPEDGSDPRVHGQKINPGQLKSVADLHYNAALDDHLHPHGDGQPTRLAVVEEWARQQQTRDLMGEFTLPDETEGTELENSVGDPSQAKELKAAEARARAYAEKKNAQANGSNGTGMAANLN